MASNCDDYERRGDADWLYADAADAGWEIDDVRKVDAREALALTVGRAFHVRVLKEIARLSEDYPGFALILTENKVTIPATSLDGFDVSVETRRGHFAVTLGEWSDEFALVGEAIALVEAALIGEIRLRNDIHVDGANWTAERRLLNGQWIPLPRHEYGARPVVGASTLRTKVLRNSYFGFTSHPAPMSLAAT